MSEETTPVFLGSPVLDALTHAVCELTSELWTVKRRLQLVESELVARGGTPLDELTITDEQASASARAANDFVASVLRAFGDVGAQAPG